MANSQVILYVLLIEDNESKINNVKEVISKCGAGILVDEVRDQVSGQRKLMEKKYDLLILDMQLPIRIQEAIIDNAGQNILEDLFTDDSSKMPNGVVVLTEHEAIKENLLEEYPDVAAILYDASSVKWKESLERKVRGTMKSKISARQVVYCENTDSLLYSLLELSNLEFRGLQDSRAIYLAAKNETDKFALRDRDFLGSSEVKNLRKVYSNYFILEYYCFENYLYHPENISEVRSDFDSENYVADILNQKNEKFLGIVQDYKMARNGYQDLLDFDKKHKTVQAEQEIVEGLKSNSFEAFYPFFDMAGKKDKENAKSFDKTFLQPYHLKKDDLAKTKWMRNRISSLFNVIP